MMRPLVIGPKERERARAVVAYAESHPIPLLRMHRIAARDEVMPSAFDRGHFAEIPVGFGAVLTVEEHPRGWMRHLSVCVREPGRRPHPVAVAEIAALFGFEGPVSPDRAYWTSGEAGAVGDAINLLEPCDPPRTDNRRHEPTAADNRPSPAGGDPMF